MTSGPDLCLFEALERPGGRTHTTESDQGMMVDVGAMRFSNDMHLPADLITGPLGLNTSCFEPSCTPDPSRQNATLRKVVDAQGQTAGFGRPIAVMLEQLQRAGARVRYGRRLTKLSDAASSAGSMRLHFATGETSVVQRAVLNMPRNALLNLSKDSLVFANATSRSHIECADNSEMGLQKMAVKAYLSYPEAWWATRLNLTEGRRVESPENREAPLVQVRYNGASHAKCLPEPSEGRVAAAEGPCPGVLEVCDDFELGCEDVPGLCWYLQFQRGEDSFRRLNSSGPEAAALETLHKRLLAMHAEELALIGLSPAALPPPTELYLGFWLSDAVLQPVQRMLGDNGPADYACLAGAEPRAFLADLQKPLADYDLLIANNDFWYTSEPHNGDWAYASLASVERLLHVHLGLAAPSWLDWAYYKEVVLGAGAPEGFAVV